MEFQIFGALYFQSSGYLAELELLLVFICKNIMSLYPIEFRALINGLVALVSYLKTFAL